MKIVLLYLTVFLFLLAGKSLAELSISEKDVIVEGRQNSGLLRKEIMFRNLGSKDIRVLGATGSCGCIISSVEKRSYSPNEEGKLILTIDSTKSLGTEVKKVLLSTDDPEKPLLEIPITLKIDPLIAISPRKVIWLKGEPLQAKTIELNVSADKEIKIIGVTSTINSVFPKLDVSDERNKHYTLTIDPSDVKGATKAVLRLETSSPELKYDYITAEIQR